MQGRARDLPAEVLCMWCIVRRVLGGRLEQQLLADHLVKTTLLGCLLCLHLLWLTIDVSRDGPAATTPLVVVPQALTSACTSNCIHSFTGQERNQYVSTSAYACFLNSHRTVQQCNKSQRSRCEGVWGSSTSPLKVDVAFVQPATAFATQQPSAHAFKPFPPRFSDFRSPCLSARPPCAVRPGAQGRDHHAAGIQLVRAGQSWCGSPGSEKRRSKHEGGATGVTHMDSHRSRRFLIFVVIAVAIMVVLANIYILIHYQHPEDRNQAWVPKIIIVLGLSLAVFGILLYPTDVANKAACASNYSPSACTYTLPMYEIWLSIFIAVLVMAFAVIPFTLFFYEADSEL